MSYLTSEHLSLLQDVFTFRSSRLRIDDARRGKRFVHYTSAESAIKIIRSNTIWLRNAKCMNDYTEVELGYGYVQKFFQKHDDLQTAMRSLNAGSDLRELFDRYWERIQKDTYVWSISEHAEEENVCGRLSMWRAFGPLPAQAAVVLKLPDRERAGALKLFFRPIAYLGYEAFENEMLSVAANIRDKADALSRCDVADIDEAVLYMFATAIACLKHPGFKEEREWRAIFWPHLVGPGPVKSETEVIGGIPQTIYKIPLKNNLSDDKHSRIDGVEIRDIIERIIIGPSAFPIPIMNAFIDVLRAAGVQDPDQKVVISDIPLRT